MPTMPTIACRASVNTLHLISWPRYAHAFHGRRTGDGTHACGSARGESDHRLHQPRCNHQDLPVETRSRGAGVPLEIIRDFLGHVDVKTTEIYARANLEMKRKALEKAADGT